MLKYSFREKEHPVMLSRPAYGNKISTFARMRSDGILRRAWRSWALPIGLAVPDTPDHFYNEHVNVIYGGEITKSCDSTAKIILATRC